MPDSAKLLIALGRLEDMKGFDTLLDAVAQLPDTHLWLLGEGSLREKLQQQARDLEYRISESEDITELRAIERQLREHLEEINKGNPALAPKYAGR